MPDPMTKEKLAELRKLAEAATPGPWTAEPHFETTALYSGRTGGNPFGGCHGLRLLNLDDGDWNFAPNRDYIAAANPKTFLSLLDALDAAEAEAGRLREVAGKLPVTADGVPVTPGMKVFWVSEDPRSIAGIMVEYITDADAYWRDRGEEMGIPLEWAMSTEAAARAAQGTSDAGKGETK